jgi:hypothetical protein
VRQAAARMPGGRLRRDHIPGLHDAITVSH